MKRLIFLAALLLYTSISVAQSADTLYIDADGVKLHAVLCKPGKAKKNSLAIIIAGSGPTDLNGNQKNMVNNSLLFLSDELVKNNIATVRFDKRGVAKSAYSGLDESLLTFERFADDVVVLIDYFKSIGYKKIYLIGHSEGSLLGLIAAQKRDVKGFVSLCGAGNPIDVVLRKQVKPQLPEAAYLQFNEILDSLKGGHMVKSVPPYLNSLFRQSVQPYMISWLRFDPAELVRSARTPILIIQGANDIQIDIQEAEALHAAIPDNKFMTISRMNHVLKTIEGDRKENIASYSNPNLPVNSQLIELLTGFISRIN